MAFNLISALRARGKNDGLAQLAADEIERLRKVEEQAAEMLMPASKPAKMTAAKKAKK